MNKIYISTHAPAGGATVSAPTRILQYPYFYSRPCGRGDFYLLPYHKFICFNISTHAPAGGATCAATCEGRGC